MQLTMSFGENGKAATVVVSGRLDIEAVTEFRLLVGGVREAVGHDVLLDLSRVAVVDPAASATLQVLVHEMREYGGRIQLPALVDAEERRPVLSQAAPAAGQPAPGAASGTSVN